MRAKKSLGQHFLRSERALSAIVDVANIHTDDLVLEIGPGEGVLTQRLAARAGKTIAVEKDDYLSEELKKRFSSEIESRKLELIHGDILEFDPSTLKSYKDLSYKLVANIPYNLTGAIIRKFLAAEHQPEQMVLLVQKEVAERIVARGGKESILSISVKAYGKPYFVETVKAGSFVPAPRVDSAIISIEGISKAFFEGFSEEKFFELLHAGFKSKRKKLSSNLSTIYPKEKVQKVFQELNVDDNVRGEDISIENWRKIALYFNT